MEKQITLSDLKGNPNNPRFISEVNAKNLSKSISKLGDLSCIVYNERFGRLVGGHQRKSVILQLIGENPKITITHDYKKPNEVQTTKEGYIEIGTERYKVRFVDFSEGDEALAVLIANDDRNKGQYDMELLPTMVDIADKSLLSVDFDLMGFIEGFNLDLGETETELEEVEFQADTNAEKELTFTLKATDFERAKARLKEIKKNFSLDTDEEALMSILFT